MGCPVSLAVLVYVLLLAAFWVNLATLTLATCTGQARTRQARHETSSCEQGVSTLLHSAKTRWKRATGFVSAEMGVFETDPWTIPEIASIVSLYLPHMLLSQNRDPDMT